MRRSLLAAAAVLSLLGAGAPAADARERFDTRVLSLIPAPGFPANAYPAPDGKAVYEGTYVNSESRAPSRVLELDATTGSIQRSWTVRGQTLDGSQGVQVATQDARGRLLLLDHTPPRVVRLDKATDEQTTYASFPAGAVPNHAVWGPDGSLYVTDYETAVLWKVPPGGGEPEPWLRDDRLGGGPFGSTGIGLRADRKTLVVALQSQLNGADASPSTGRMFELPIGDDGKPGPLRQLWESRPFDGPDAFGIAQSGRIYISLLLANQLAVVEPDGGESARFGPENGSAVPFDNPSSARFLGTRLVIANQSFVNNDPAHQAVLDVETGEPGLPELIPAGAGSRDARPPVVSALRLGGRPPVLRFALDEPARVGVVVERRVGTRWRAVRRTALDLSAGTTTRRLKALAGARKAPRRGSWRVTLTATDGEGNVARPVRVVVRVR